MLALQSDVPAGDGAAGQTPSKDQKPGGGVLLSLLPPTNAGANPAPEPLNEQSDWYAQTSRWGSALQQGEAPNRTPGPELVASTNG